MKNNYLLVLLFAVLFSNAQAQKKILFIGNSMTYFNDMPILFESIANEKGKNVDVDFYAPGGTGFVNHHVDNNVYDLFENNVWDVVVLQPGTSESAGVSWPVSTTAERGNQMQDSIKKYSPCAKVLLYQIPYGVPSADNYANYFQIQTKIKDSITKLADNMEVSFAAAGECARQHYLAQQDLLLHGSYNDVHPNLNGSYLVACAMFCTIFQEPVSGVAFNGGVTPANATYFQGIADNIVLNNKALWRINTFDLHPEFSTAQTDNLVNFTNLSTNFTSLLWDFGDGTTSTDTNPEHFYTSLGTKTVTLTVTKNGCSEVFTKNIVVNVLNSDVFVQDNIAIFPTITDSVFYINSKFSFDGVVYDSVGQQITKFEKTENNIIVDLSGFASGVYIVKIDNDSYKVIKK
ncbi:PKD domain-containing protein [Flavobacterium terrigena]|uniref:Por secretion system C-terminal sorting domain-containing protein n=1 Tax=Flavobacterium terrigena TaxID=402734 RepID=A0A1H6S4Z6_9FLAO|nr:PKD domain-containing protein [Flavobacterium terrigena]SEI58482.1 Por secretion system C-terminal sorting domain-containing protein [Flavobacterium terrigena]